MAYEKVTLDVFKKKLKNGEYKGLIGARRAIGKSTAMSEKEIAVARAAAESRFGVKKAAKKTVKKASNKG